MQNNEETENDNEETDNVSNLTYVNYIPVQKLGDLQPGFSMASLNVRSMLKNGNKVDDYIKQTDIDILAVQETWESNMAFNTHDFIQINRSKKRGGGVGFLIRKSNLPNIKQIHIQRH